MKWSREPKQIFDSVPFAGTRDLTVAAAWWSVVPVFGGGSWRFVGPRSLVALRPRLCCSHSTFFEEKKIKSAFFSLNMPYSRSYVLQTIHLTSPAPTHHPTRRQHHCTFYFYYKYSQAYLSSSCCRKRGYHTSRATDESEKRSERNRAKPHGTVRVKYRKPRSCAPGRRSPQQQQPAGTL